MREIQSLIYKFPEQNKSSLATLFTQISDVCKKRDLRLRYTLSEDRIKRAFKLIYALNYCRKVPEILQHVFVLGICTVKKCSRTLSDESNSVANQAVLDLYVKLSTCSPADFSRITCLVYFVVAVTLDWSSCPVPALSKLKCGDEEFDPALLDSLELLFYMTKSSNVETGFKQCLKSAIEKTGKTDIDLDTFARQNGEVQSLLEAVSVFTEDWTHWSEDAVLSNVDGLSKSASILACIILGCLSDNYPEPETMNERSKSVLLLCWILLADQVSARQIRGGGYGREGLRCRLTGMLRVSFII